MKKKVIITLFSMGYCLYLHAQQQQFGNGGRINQGNRSFTYATDSFSAYDYKLDRTSIDQAGKGSYIINLVDINGDISVQLNCDAYNNTCIKTIDGEEVGQRIESPMDLSPEDLNRFK